MANAEEFYKEGSEGKPEDPIQDLNEVQVSELVSIIRKRFDDASRARQVHENRMIEAYNNFRGLYDKKVRFRQSEKSRVFVKATKTKVLAGYGQVMDIALGSSRFPVEVSATYLPEGIDDVAYISPEMDPAADQVEPIAANFDVGYAGDGKELPAGATFGSRLKDLLGIGKDSKAEFVKAGVNADPTKLKIRPADNAAYKMDKLIQDQLEESNARAQLSNSVFEAVMLGTGIIKGPFNYTKTLHKWCKEEGSTERVYKAVHTRVPRIEFVSVWDAYPDPNATCKEELSFFIHRHRFNESQIRNLIKMPLFNEEEILNTLIDGPQYTKQSYEDFVIATDEEGVGRDFSDRYEVLEYWGVMGVKEAEERGLKIEEQSSLGEVQINAWVCGGRLLRVVVNPFKPARIPYHIFNYEKNPYSIFGIGVPENMSDSQQMMNGFARMAIDNLALAGGLVFDIDETNLVPGQEMSIYNGKVFYRQAGSTGQSVFGIKFPNTAQENLMMFDKFRQLADEETGLPSYSHGQTGVTSTTRTAAGMSMLMGAASLNIKTVIKNLDQQLLEPLGKDLFHWNMQFFEGELDVRGDLEIRATATNSLMQKEVRSQRLTSFLNLAMNPQIAPFVNLPYIVEEIASSMDLDKDKVLSSTEEARAYAQIIGLQNLANNNTQAGAGTGPQQPSMEPPQGMGGPPDSFGPQGNGDGNIGTGDVAMPGQDQYSANAPLA